MRATLISIVLMIFANAGAAQTTRSEPLPADQMLRDLLDPGATPTGRPATQPSATSMQPEGFADLSRHDGLLREGTELVNRSGRMHKTSDGAWQVLSFEHDETTAGLASMRVLPDLKLMSMENACATTGRDLQFDVSGVVTEYGGANYILLEASPEDEMSRARHTTGSSVKGSESRLTAEQLLSAMLPPQSAPGRGAGQAANPLPHRNTAQAGPMSDRTSGAAAVAPGAPIVNVLRERSQVVDRTGRLTRSSDGQQAELTFDADASAMRDPPLVILPNLKLASMESAVKATSKDLRFRVTGMVTEYRGRNYVLIEKALVVPDAIDQF